MRGVTDDRGHPVLPPDGVLRDGSPLPAQERALLAALLKTHDGLARRIIVVAGLAIVAWSLVFGAGVLYPALLPPWLTLALGPVVMIGGAVALRRARTRSQRRTLARMLADRGYCGSCAYPLAGLPVMADHARECPECHACWTLRQVGENETDRDIVRQLRRSDVPGLSRDDAGRPVSLLPLEAFRPESGPEGPIPLEARRRLIQAWGTRQRGLTGRILAGVTVSGLLVACVIALVLYAFLGRSAVPWLLLAAMGPIVVPLVSYPLLRRWWRRRFYRHIIAGGHCPACGGALRGEQGPEPCPTCGATWRAR